MKKILLTICIILLPGTVLGFTDNSGVPTTNNTPIPINSSSSTQVKTGPLVSDSYMQADFFSIDIITGITSNHEQPTDSITL